MLNGPASSAIFHPYLREVDPARTHCVAFWTPSSTSCAAAAPGAICPVNYPPWQTVFYHFRRLRLQGKWHLLYTALHRAERERVGRHPDPSAASHG